MLYKIPDTNKFDLVPLEFFDVTTFGQDEKYLENLLSENLPDIFQLLTVFQERPWQSEPDILALDANGDLYIFELKRATAGKDAIGQILGYLSKYGRVGYEKLNELFHTHEPKYDNDLKSKHQEIYQLTTPLAEGDFNRKQKLFIIGRSSDQGLINDIEFWRSQGIDIDFIPYRIYKMDNGGHSEYYFEFFAKPFDYQHNPADRKGIIFDTNSTYDENAIWDMLANKKVSAYGGNRHFVSWFNKGDYVFYYHRGYGIVAGGEIISDHMVEDSEKDECYQRVRLFTPPVQRIEDLRYLTPTEMKSLHDNKGFYYAHTVKRPYLYDEDLNNFKEAIMNKYL